MVLCRELLLLNYLQCIFAIIAAVSAGGIVPAAPLIAAAPAIAAVPAPIVTARSSQVIARNYNTFAAAPLAYAPAPAHLTYAAPAAIASAQLAYTAPAAIASAPLAYTAPAAVATGPLAYNAAYASPFGYPAPFAYGAAAAAPLIFRK